MGKLLPLWWLALACAGSGCSQVVLEDDVDLTLDFVPLTGPSGALNSPYVEGSSMHLFVRSSDNHESYANWHIDSSAPTVFSVGPLTADSGAMDAEGDARALMAGDADLLVYDGNGRLVAQEHVQVRRPDEIHFFSAGLLLIGRSDDQSQLSELRILAGGTGTFLARYYAGGVELHGNGTLSLPGTMPVSAPAAGTANVVSTFLLENRDWLQVTPANSGDASVALNINGTPFGSFPVASVPATDVSAITVLGQDESGHKSGDWLVTFAQSDDASGRAIYGVTYTWQLGGMKEDGLGDLFRYEYKPQEPASLTASFGTLTGTTDIHTNNGYVDSTNNVGCQAGPTEKSTSIGGIKSAAVLCGLMLLALRRRRRRIGLNILG